MGKGNNEGICVGINLFAIPSYKMLKDVTLFSCSFSLAGEPKRETMKGEFV